MVVELSMAATIPGFLVGLHYVIQLSRPKWGLASDVDNNRTKWIILGMLILALGANLATVSLSIFSTNYTTAFVLSVIAYALIGVGVGASGTSLLALMAKHTLERRRPAAAMITWLMMIFGIAMTCGAGWTIDCTLQPRKVNKCRIRTNRDYSRPDLFGNLAHRTRIGVRSKNPAIIHIIG
jgi:BCD family chlorophyll transporter-like MFS transporter